MYKKLTITLPESIYLGLHKKIGKRKISQFIAKLVKPHVEKRDLAKEYAQMATDKERENEAEEWCEGLIGDIQI